MNIAIVDDQKNDRLWIADKVTVYMKKNNLDFKITEYENAETLLKEFFPGKFDILFLDIYMGKTTGMDAALWIRKQDFDCKLIFITVSDEYLRQGYCVNASHYLVKPVSDTDFEQAMNFCRLIPRYAVPFLDVVTRGVSVHLNTSKILYINIEHRAVHIHTLIKTFSVSGTFRSVTQSLLADRRFLLCIQGVMVNMDMIVDQADSLFLLKNGEQLPINLRKRKSVINTWQAYIFENMNR
ncbi:MAG: LytR/AlgR family response regulator transcription factor [Marvinbryantia sp.]